MREPSLLASERTVLPHSGHGLPIILAALLAAPAPLCATERCIEYGSAQLAGILVRQTYPGPPEYESLSKGDEPQVIWVLQLQLPTCVTGSSPGYATEYNAREVQLELPSDGSIQARDLLGKHVLVTGQLTQGGARHDKRLVLGVGSIRKVRSSWNPQRSE